VLAMIGVTLVRTRLAPRPGRGPLDQPPTRSDPAGGARDRGPHSQRSPSPSLSHVGAIGTRSPSHGCEASPQPSEHARAGRGPAVPGDDVGATGIACRSEREPVLSRLARSSGDENAFLKVASVSTRLPETPARDDLGAALSARHGRPQRQRKHARAGRPAGRTRPARATHSPYTGRYGVRPGYTSLAPWPAPHA
jgi:hypothetical protein